jgi:hypothetical protein
LYSLSGKSNFAVDSFEERYEHHRAKKRKLAVEDPAQEKGEDGAPETKSVLSSATS